MIKLVLVRHGESTWNLENRFSGWTDVPLTDKGKEEAKEGARLLKEGGYDFDVIHTSVLKRATDTTDIIVEEMGLDVPVHNSWRLNERHYGALQGLNKAETAEKHGDEQVKIWRRSYDIRPPALDRDDDRYPGKDEKYADLTEDEIPLSECLKDTVERVLPYWNDVIVPELKEGKKVLISAHGNSLRALVKYLDDMPEKEILEFNIPTGVPLVYELDDDLKPIKRYFLGDAEALKKKMEAVANQGKAKQ